MFAPDKFGDLSVDLVMQALEFGQSFRRQQAHQNELGIATLTSCFVNANRDPKKGAPAKPSDFFYFSGDNPISPAIANAFFSLISDKQMPSWVVHAAPIDLLVKSKTDGQHRKYRRMLVGTGVAIFAPVISADDIYSDFVVFNEAEWGWMKVQDIDSERIYEIFVAPPDYDQQYCRDMMFERR